MKNFYSYRGNVNNYATGGYTQNIIHHRRLKNSHFIRDVKMKVKVAKL